MHQEFLHSKTLRNVLIGLGVLIVVCVVFGLGVLVGYRNAIFNARFGMEYYRNFSTLPPGPLGMPGGPVTMSGYGVAGKVLAVGTSSIAVEDNAGNEQAIIVGSDTMIREGGGTISLAGVSAGDTLVAIGDPGSSGAMRARFIRVFTATSSMPVIIMKKIP